MAAVVFLKGVNVGGRRFRPSVLAKQLRRLDVVSIGAAGTFVVRRPVARTELRREMVKRVPFEVHATICSANEILGLVSRDPFAGETQARDIVAFVGVVASRGPAARALPPQIPAAGRWCVRVLQRDGRFVVGVHRREMKAISCLGQIEKIVGASVAIRSWGTILAIAKVLEA